jgi:WD40 repeat protein
MAQSTTTKIILTFALSLIVFNLTGRAQKAELVVETSHTSIVGSVAFSPDGRLVATSSGDGTAKLWDAASRKELKTLVDSSGIGPVAFSPDGKTLASGTCKERDPNFCVKGEIIFWDVESGTRIKALEAHTSQVISLAFSPDGKTLASGSSNQVGFYESINQRRYETVSGSGSSVQLWDVASGKILKALPHYTSVFSVEFSPDGRTLAAGSDDNLIKLWDVESGIARTIIRGNNVHPEAGVVYESMYLPIYSFAFSPDGRTLASTNSYSLQFWDTATGKEIRPPLHHGRDKTVMSVAFSPNGKTLALGNMANKIELLDVATGKILKEKASPAPNNSVAFSPRGKTVASGNSKTLTFWDIETGETFDVSVYSPAISSAAFLPGGKLLTSGNQHNDIRLWDIASETVVNLKHLDTDYTGPEVTLSPDRNTIAVASDKALQLWDVESGKIKSSLPHQYIVRGSAFSPDGRMLVTMFDAFTFKLWDVATGRELNTFPYKCRSAPATSITFSPDSGYFVAAEYCGVITLWDVASGSRRELIPFSDQTNFSMYVAFSTDGRLLAVRRANVVKILDPATGRILNTLSQPYYFNAMAFSPDGKRLATSGLSENKIKLWDVASGRVVGAFPEDDAATGRRVFSVAPEFYWTNDSRRVSADGRFQIRVGENGKLDWHDFKTGRLIVTLVTTGETDWVVATPDGRFDTNKPLDRIEGLHWVVNDEILKPLPLDVFMRQYYEPGLFQRVLKCTEENNCDKEFKLLPLITDINRVQPRVSVTQVTPSTGTADSVDVAVEVESVTEDVSVSATDRTKKRRLTSGAYDLRLFRDGQLVGVSTPADKLARFIGDAPRLVTETRTSGRLVGTPEDRAWREVNDIFQLHSENIKTLTPAKLRYTFRNIKLPGGGRREVLFTAYGFNSDKVKSMTSAPFKFAVPAAVANAPKKGRAFLVSIGVNASENPAYDLRYAVNDARKMQEIVGARLKAYGDKYSEVIQLLLTSDYGPDKRLAENTAQKAIIKGVFSLLAGKEKEVPPDVLGRIPSRDQIRPVEPGDTLIIAYSGHGYADRSGIFYLLPYDIGAGTGGLTPDTPQRAISSDELSLWMLDITADEMIMIIDACHSSAAVQGNGFKPGPMGSRGLGQLAYDKDMKILSATQTDNIALEAKSLGQGLLSYALLEDGINQALADTDKDKQLYIAEWLSFAVKRVPELYREVREGRRGVVIDGRNIKGDEGRRVFELAVIERNYLNLQNPHLFDFKRRAVESPLFKLD